MYLPKSTLLDKIINKVGYWLPILAAFTAYAFIAAGIGIVIVAYIATWNSPF